MSFAIANDTSFVVFEKKKRKNKWGGQQETF